MALTFFTRRPSPVPTAACVPEPCPQTGETWQPEGVSVRERYYNQSQAIVLVYCLDSEGGACFVACLGCHYASARDTDSTYRTCYSLTDAAKAANTHATACRALPRAIPARPDDDTVRERLHSWARGRRSRKEDVQLWLSELDFSRLALQRSKDWIVDALQQLATDQPDILPVSRSDYGDHVYTSYYACRLQD
ncbi:hypothetical protein [Streptomyces sp. NPDC006552]|uniref:hypothetical protein n=1 Tax=Streptomyces sp. NPDC006552 TaxID=3157179 RepID=UPI00339F113E